MLLIGTFCWKILTDVFYYRVLWKSKKDELQDTEDNTEVTCYLAYAIAATIVMVKYTDSAKHFIIQLRNTTWRHRVIKTY